MEKTSVGILIFENVEVLDFAGPFEVFSRTRTVAGAESRRSDDDATFQVFTVATTTDPPGRRRLGARMAPRAAARP